jgi:hypothetical protein
MLILFIAMHSSPVDHGLTLDIKTGSLKVREASFLINPALKLLSLM